MKLPGWIVLLGCCALFVVGGCGSDGPGSTLSGKITRNGQPLSLQPGEKIIINVYELDAQGALALNSYQGIIDTTNGSYTVDINPGKLRVAVEIVKAGEGDALKGNYTMQNSPIVVDAEGDVEDFEIAVTDG